MKDKKLIVNYILYKLVEWQKIEKEFCVQSSLKDNDISILKAISIIFFLCTIDEDKDDRLIDILDNFKLQTLGIIEIDCLNYMLTENNFINYTKVTESNLNYEGISNKYIDIIDRNIVMLKSKNIDLIFKPPFYMVDLINHLKEHNTFLFNSDIIPELRNKPTIWYSF